MIEWEKYYKRLAFETWRLKAHRCRCTYFIELWFTRCTHTLAHYYSRLPNCEGARGAATEMGYVYSVHHSVGIVDSLRYEHQRFRNVDTSYEYCPWTPCVVSAAPKPTSDRLRFTNVQYRAISSLYCMASLSHSPSQSRYSGFQLVVTG